MNAEALHHASILVRHNSVARCRSVLLIQSGTGVPTTERRVLWVAKLTRSKAWRIRPLAN